MTVNLQQEINQIVELKRRATQLDNLIQGYRLCARTEGKSAKSSVPAILHGVSQIINNRTAVEQN
jgi:hypothetical protein